MDEKIRRRAVTCPSQDRSPRSSRPEAHSQRHAVGPHDTNGGAGVLAVVLFKSMFQCHLGAMCSVSLLYAL